MSSLKSLNSDQMVAISKRWLDPSKERPLLEKYDTVKPQLKKLDAIHAQLVHGQASSTGQDQALTAVKTTEQGVDGVHDRKITGVVGLLVALASLTDDRALHDRYLGLVDRLVPDGLNIVRASYLAEAGAAARTEGRLEHEDIELLASIPLPAELKNLKVQFDAYLDAGLRLGDLEAERTRIEGTPSGPSKSDAVKTRNAWIGQVNAILGNLETEDVPEDDLVAVVGPLHKAQAQAAHASREVEKVDASPATPVQPTPAPAPKP